MQLYLNSYLTLNEKPKSKDTFFYKNNKKICFGLYGFALIWFICLVNLNFNYKTYISEPALNIRAVMASSNTDSVSLAEIYGRELKQARKKYKSDIPIQWLITKMKNIGLETYVHNFTIRVPFRKGKTYQGRNIYGILRAPKSASAEGIVISTPYRSQECSIPIEDSIPVLLTTAEYASRQIYWSKDLIFLITEYEQLGLLAWLNAYYNTEEDNKNNDILKSNRLIGRSGSLLAAINLEIQSLNFEYLDLKIEGLNGRLSNLDLFNIINRFADFENVTSGYKQISRKLKAARIQSFNKNFGDLITMMFSVASGVPTGLHGLFLKYRIEALTLHTVKFKNKTDEDQIVRISLLKIIPKILRSLSSLTEKFHSSFFYYLLIGCDRYISIGDYIICQILMIGSLLIKAYILFCSSKRENYQTNEVYLNNLILNQATKIFGLSLLFGVIARYVLLDESIYSFFTQNDSLENYTLPMLLIAVSIIASLSPKFIQLSKIEYEILHIITLSYIAVVLAVVGLLNFSLGFLLSVFIVPLAILIDTNHQEFRNFKILYSILLQPLIAVIIIEFAIILARYPELNYISIGKKLLETIFDTINTSATDSIIYNNWLFTIWSLVLFPAWILCWILNFPTKTIMLPKKDIKKII